MMQTTKLTYAENQSEDSLVLLSLQLSKINCFPIILPPHDIKTCNNFEESKLLKTFRISIWVPRIPKLGFKSKTLCRFYVFSNSIIGIWPESIRKINQKTL